MYVRVCVPYRLLHALMDLNQTWHMYVSFPGKKILVWSHIEEINPSAKMGEKGAGQHVCVFFL